MAGRPSHKVKAEHPLRVEISRWHRSGYLRGPIIVAGNRGDEPTGNIGVVVHGADRPGLAIHAGQ
jgi:hypothetical protein